MTISNIEHDHLNVHVQLWTELTLLLARSEEIVRLELNIDTTMNLI